MSVNLIHEDLEQQVRRLKEEADRYLLAEEALRESEERYRCIVENSHNAIFMLSDNYEFVYANDQFCELTGYSRNEFIEKDFRLFIDDDQKKFLADIYRRRLQGEDVFSHYNFYLTRKDGERRKVEIRASAVTAPQGKERTVGFLLDITRRSEALKQLKESEKRYRTILEEIQDAYYEVDLRGSLTFFNQQMCNLLGYTKEELTGLNNRAFMDEINAALVYQTFNQVFRTEEPSSGFDWRLIRKDQSEIWVNTSVALIKDKAGNKIGFRGIIRDITRQKVMEKELHRMAYFDDLTGLANRSLLKDRFQKAIARAYRYGTLLVVYVVDMNQTKEINDTLGHLAGDEMIKEVAHRLQMSVRESDTVARTGGDEFVILGEGIHLEKGAWDLGQKIVDSIKEEPFDIYDSSVFQEVSVGFSIYPLDSEDPETLLRQADVAMYYAKESLHSRPHRYSLQNDQLSVQFSLAQELRKAIEKNEFLVFYQPQVDLKTREVIGMEALLRWDHPEKGLISPSDFIPMLERTGLIRAVGLRVEKSVCQQIAQWRQEKRGLTQKTINCCIYELNNPTMLDELLATIKEYRIDSSLIGIEITERVATRQIDEVRNVLQSLSDAGITILLDDFGTGYSSLSLLQQLPIDIVKIDKSFIQSMTEDNYSASLVRAIITMCHETDKKVMAEGIETEAQLEYLLELNCDYGQGFLFGHPAPPDKIFDPYL
jgi:diguanylate cyclase (GGDEF)-like protein/PAS domain S-box-containing protein